MTGSEANKMMYLEYQDGGQSNLKDLASSDRRKPREQKLNYLFLILVYYQGSHKIHKTWLLIDMYVIILEYQYGGDDFKI